MPDTASLNRFIPPHWPIATGKPSIGEHWRSVSNTLLGWSNDVYGGGIYQAKLPSAPLVIGDADLAVARISGRTRTSSIRTVLPQATRHQPVPGSPTCRSAPVRSSAWAPPSP